MKSIPRWLLSVLVGGIIILLVCGVWFYRTEELHLKKEAEARLDAIATEKEKQILEWRRERIADASVISESPYFQAAYIEWKNKPDPFSTTQITSRLASLIIHYHYSSIRILDQNGNILLIVPDTTSHHSDYIKNEIDISALKLAFETAKPQMTDLHLSSDMVPHLSIVAPLIIEGQPQGAIQLIYNAEDFLYPQIQSWLSNSRSAEILLIRQEGDSILFLNELRHKQNTALKFKLPVSTANLPAAMVISGREGIVEGIDYRGVKVLAVLKKIPDTQWCMIAKIDADEALAAWRHESVMIFSGIFGLLVALISFMLTIWQRNAKAQYRSLLAVERARNAAEQSSSLILQSIGDGVITTDGDGRIQRMNPVAEMLTGWRFSEAATKDLSQIFKIVNEDTGQEVENPVTKVLREGTTIGLGNHTLLIAKDGSQRPIADSGAPILDEYGNILGVVLIFRDQIAERAALKLLERSEEKYRTLFDRMLEGYAYCKMIYENDVPVDFVYLDVNPAFEMLTGLKDVTGKNVSEVIPGITATDRELFEIYGRVAKTGTPESFEFYVEALQQWFSLSVFSPQVDHFVAVFDVITERKQAEKALKESEAALKRSQATAHVGHWTWDTKSNTVQWSDEMHRIFGIDRDDFKGDLSKVIEAAIHPDDREKVRKANEAVITERHPAPMEYRVIRSDGSVRQILAIPDERITDDNGNIIKLQGIVQDITEIHATESALRENEAMLRNAARLARLGPWEYDAVNDIFTFNDAFYDILHTSAAEIGGYNMSSQDYAKRFVHPDDAYLVGVEVSKALVTDDPNFYSQLEHRIIYGDGGIGYIGVRFWIAKDQTGRTVRTFGVNQDITDRRLAEQSIRESEERYRNLIDLSPDMIGLYRDGKLLFINPAGAKMFGVNSPDEMVGKPVMDLVHPDYRSAVYERVANMLKSGEPAKPYAEKFIRVDGTSFDVEVVAIPIGSPESRTVQVIARDITERIRAEKAIRDSEQRYRILMETSPDNIILVDLEGNIIAGNQQTVLMHGYSDMEELLAQNKNALGHIAPEDREEAMVLLKRVVEDGSVKNIEFGILRKDGSVLQTEASASVITDDSGVPKYIVGVIRDISERKKAEKALKASEEQFRSLFDNATIGIYRTSPEGRIRIANLAMLKIMGFDSLEEYSNRMAPNRGYVNASDAEEFIRRMEADGEVYGFETAWIRKDGTAVYVRESSRAVRDAEGVLLYYEGTVEDITERKEAEEALRQSEERYKYLSSMATEGIFVHRNGYILEANHAAAKTFGFSEPSEFIGKLGYEVINFTPESKQIVTDHVNSVSDELYEVRLYDLNNKIITIETFGKDTIYHGEPARLVYFTDITNRKRMERALVDSEKKYREVVEGISDAIFTMDLNGYFIFANRTTEKITGYSIDHLRQLTYLDMVEPSHRPRVKRHYLKHYVKKQLQSYIEFPIIRRDGQKIWMGQSATPLLDGDNIVGFQLVTRDITDRIKAEEIIHRSEERFRGLFENATVGIYRTLPDGTVLMANPAFLKIAGYDSLEDLLSRKADNRGYASVKDAKEFIGRITQDGYIRGYEAWWRRKDGTAVFIRESARVVKDDEGNVLYYEGIFEDISDLKRSESALKQSEELFRHVIEESNDAIYILYNDRFELINRRFTEIFGLTYKDVSAPGFNLLNIVAPESKDIVADRRERRLMGEKISPRYEFKALGMNGSILSIEASVTEIKYKGGKAIQGILRDVTDRNRLEEQLRVSQKMEAIGKLAGGIAHDFNNLLTVISGNLELLLEVFQPEDPRTENLNEIAHATKRAATLTRQLLAFSRKQTLEPHIININKIVVNMEKMLRRIIGEDIELLSKLDDNLETVKFDPGQIEQVIMNLVVNARDAMPNGGQLWVETDNIDLDSQFVIRHPEIKPGRYVMLSISDNGIGMTSEVRSRIFEPFFTTKGQGKGTGLGLATVYGIVKQSGGSIWVYSEPGHGTTFKIYLPVVHEIEDDYILTQENKDVTGGTETVLLVEDEAGVRKLAEKLLLRLGYTVYPAANGQEALEILISSKKPIDIILTDVVMPGINGKELIKQSLLIRPKIKALYMSGYTSNAIVHSGVLDKGTPYLQKPFRPVDLARKVREVLDKSA